MKRGGLNSNITILIQFIIDFWVILCILLVTPKIAKSLRLFWTYALDPAYCRVARDVRVTAIYWVKGQGRTFITAHDMGRRLSNASPTPWSRVKSRWFSSAGTGIPEYSGDSGVIRDSEVQPKGGSCKKIPPKKKESWGILAGTKNRDQEMDIPETGKCNLGRNRATKLVFNHILW
jgi:hypothetical protein